MHTRIVMAIMTWFLVSGISAYPLALGAVKTDRPSGLLSQEHLRGSMQGQSGIALDLNGDGREDLVVGAPYAQRGGKGATGALLVYLANPGGFSPKPSVLLEGDGNLGWSLVALGDVDGDGNADFAAGAFSGSSEVASLAGTVNIYKGSNPPQKVPGAVLSGENALDKFGYALAVGDLNGDGYPDLIVGAPFHSPSPALYQRGAVYIFFGPGYDQAKAVKIPATSANGGIGFSLATGDINGDGVDDLLLQASSKVICYYGSSGSFTPSAPNVVFSSSDGGFGKSIAVLPNGIVAMGADTAAVANVSESGNLSIFKLNTNVTPPSPELLVKIDGEPNCGRFGSAILPLPDIGDGTPGLAVSAVHADGNHWPMTGKISLFSLTTGAAGAIVTPAKAFPGEARDMHLGTFLAQAAGGRKLAAGAPTENANTGAVRLFDLR